MNADPDPDPDPGTDADVGVTVNGTALNESVNVAAVTVPVVTPPALPTQPGVSADVAAAAQVEASVASGVGPAWPRTRDSGDRSTGYRVAVRNPTAATAPRLEEVLVIALAAQRIARAISTDEITRPLRDRLDRWAEPAGGVRGSVASLARCPVCTGWWTSLAVSAAWPGTGRFRRGLSVAGAQVLLTLIERLVSEQGRASIHQADIGEAHSNALNSSDDGS